MVLFVVFEVLYIPNGVIIDDELKQLTLKYQFGKEKVIGINNMSMYKDVWIKQKGGDRDGVVVYLTNKKPVLLCNLNLKDYLPVKRFLDNIKIETLDEGKFNFLMYFIHQ